MSGNNLSKSEYDQLEYMELDKDNDIYNLEPKFTDIIGSWGLGYYTGTALKHMLRYRQSGKRVFIKKAIWYLKQLLKLDKERNK